MANGCDIKITQTKRKKPSKLGRRKSKGNEKEELTEDEEESRVPEKRNKEHG